LFTINSKKTPKLSSDYYYPSRNTFSAMVCTTNKHTSFLNEKTKTKIKYLNQKQNIKFLIENLKIAIILYLTIEIQYCRVASLGSAIFASVKNTCLSILE